MGKYDHYTKYKVSIQDKVGIIRFSDLPKNNLTVKMMEELTDILEKFKTDDDIRSVLFTHEGPDFSCGGGDDEQEYIDRGMTMEAVLEMFADLGGNLVKTLVTYPKPTVVSATGLAWGGAAALYECFDIRIASETFRLYDADVYWGSAGTWGLMTTHLPLWVGRNKLLDFILLGEFNSGRQLMELGMVSRVYSDTVLYEASFAIAKKLATAAPLVVKAYKERMYDVIYGDHLPEWRRKELETGAEVNASEDARVGFEYAQRGEQYEFKGR